MGFGCQGIGSFKLCAKNITNRSDDMLHLRILALALGLGLLSDYVVNEVVYHPIESFTPLWWANSVRFVLGTVALLIFIDPE